MAEVATAPAPAPAAEPIEPAAPGEELEEDEFATEELDGPSSASTSLTSSIFNHTYENGRRFHQYRTGRYPIPNDDTEQQRDNMKHAMMLELTDGKLFLAPIADHPQKILDLGTGTGIWAIEVADKYPGAEVLGVDLSPIQPAWVPTNLKFVVDDIEDEWALGDNWDLVHMRCISPWMKDQAKLLSNCYKNLKPGGWVEIQEFDARANCDDGTLSSDAPLLRFFDTCAVAVKKFNMNFRAGEALREPLEAAGFTNVSCVVMKVPIGTWARDKRLRLVGLYLKLAVTDMFSAMAAKPLLSLMNPVEIELFLADARKDINNPRIHAYEKFFFWVGQKPKEQ